MSALDITGTLAGDLDLVRETGVGLDLPVWLVGGPVRDAILGRPVNDLDFLVEGRVEEIAAAVARRLGGSVRTHPEFLTAKVLHPSGRMIDFTTARAESYPRPGALPVVRPSSVRDDLLRRDFTINAIAYALGESTFIDPAGGISDLDRRHIRILHDTSFIDDPTRIFRAIRCAVRLQFEVEPETHERMHEALRHDALTTISPQRVWREVALCLREPDPAVTLAALLRDGILQRWLGAESADPGLESRLALLHKLSREHDDLDGEVLYLATLVDGIRGATIPGGTGFSRRRRELLERLITRRDDRVEEWTRLTTEDQRGRFCLALAPEEVVFCSLATNRARDILPICREVRSQSLPFNGDDLGVEPGPHIGKALRDTRIRAWLEPSDPQTLLEFARDAALRYLSEEQS